MVGSRGIAESSAWCSVLTQRNGMWGGVREVKEEGDICIHIADSLHCTAQTQHCRETIHPPPIKKKIRVKSACGCSPCSLSPSNSRGHPGGKEKQCLVAPPSGYLWELPSSNTLLGDTWLLSESWCGSRESCSLLCKCSLSVSLLGTESSLWQEPYCPFLCHALHMEHKTNT